MASETKLKVRIAKIATANPKVKDALADFEAALKLASAAKRTLAEALRDTPEWRLLQGVGSEPFVSVDRYGSVRLISQVQGDYEPRRDTLAPQTLNVLITGKLLNDEEKRQLLANEGIRLTKPTPPSKPDDDAPLHIYNFDDEIPF